MTFTPFPNPTTFPVPSPFCPLEIDKLNKWYAETTTQKSIIDSAINTLYSKVLLAKEDERETLINKYVDSFYENLEPLLQDKQDLPPREGVVCFVKQRFFTFSFPTGAPPDLKNSWESEVYAVMGVASVVFGGYLSLFGNGIGKKSLGVGFLGLGAGYLLVSLTAGSLKNSS